MYAIRCDHIVTPGGIVDGFVIVGSGKISDVETKRPASEMFIIDHTGKVLLPGVVDPHVHINEPGRTHWEGFDSATRAAIAGGVTSLIDMPLNSSPVTTTVNAYRQKYAAADGNIHCDCGFWGGIVPGSRSEPERLIQMGAKGFKAFLIDSGIEEFPPVTRTDLEAVLPILAHYRVPLLAHCELERFISKGWPDKRSYRQYLSSRPPEAEEKAIEMLVELSEAYNCPVHIVHVSSAGSVEIIRKAKEKGLPVTAETAQHYLYFCAEEIPDGETQYKCAPPIRDRTNNEMLLAALSEGVIDFVATDHSPAPPDLKKIDTGDFQSAWGGIASLQFSLQALWSVLKRNDISVALLSKWLSEKPALLPRLHSKGKIEKGYDADLVVFSPHKEVVISEEKIRHRHKITPYLGKTLFGETDTVYLRGEKIYQNGIFLHLKGGRIL